MAPLFAAVVAALIFLAQPSMAQEISPKQTECLAQAIYHESRDQPIEGQAAVAYVVLHRAALWRKSPCEIIHQPHQFAFYQPGHEKKIVDQDAWRLANRIAIDVQTDQLIDRNKDTLYFTGGPIHPWKNTKLVMTIGAHHFYAEAPNAIQPRDHRVLVAKNPTKISPTTAPIIAQLPAGPSWDCQSGYHVGFVSTSSYFPTLGFASEKSSEHCRTSNKLMV